MISMKRVKVLKCKKCGHEQGVLFQSKQHFDPVVCCDHTYGYDEDDQTPAIGHWYEWAEIRSRDRTRTTNGRPREFSTTFVRTYSLRQVR